MCRHCAELEVTNNEMRGLMSVGMRVDNNVLKQVDWGGRSSRLQHGSVQAIRTSVFQVCQPQGPTNHTQRKRKRRYSTHRHS